MINTQNNKRPVEIFLVGKADEALYNTAGSGNNITDLTGAVEVAGTTVLADGQVGVFDDSGYGSNGINTALASGNTIAHSPSIYIAAGLEKDPVTNLGINYGYPLYPRPFERSRKINGKNRILITRQNYVQPQYSTAIVGSPTAAAAQQIVPLDNTEYTIAVAQRSRFNSMLYSSNTSLSEDYSYVTPNYTDLGTVDPLDHLVQNLVYQIDRNSSILGIKNSAFHKGNSNVIAFAIASTDAGSSYDVNSGSAGDVVTVVDGVAVGGTITMTAELLDSINAAINGDTYWTVPTNVYIVPVNLATAGTAANAEAILILGTDRNLVFKDKIIPVKNRIKVGLKRGFDYTTVWNNETTNALEGQGIPRALEIQYESTHGQRLTENIHTEDPVIKFPSPFVSTAKYVTFNILHEDTGMISTGNSRVSPHRTILCIPNTETTFLSAFTTLMNTWLASTGNPAIESI